MHYFWIGAVPAMLFLGVSMMPFYYGSGVRSVPEFIRRRFGTGAHLVNAISFVVDQLLIAGINLYLLATIVNRLLGWPLWVSLLTAAAGAVPVASFMAGIAANISAFNTVFRYDLWQTYIVKDKQHSYYTGVGRVATVAATLVAIGTAVIASSYSNLMDYLQTLFGFFNAPLFATFVLGMFP